MDIPKNHETFDYYATDDILLVGDTPQVVITGAEVNDERQADTGVEQQLDTSVVGVPELRTVAEPLIEQDDQPTVEIVDSHEAVTALSPEIVPEESTLVQAFETPTLAEPTEEAPVEDAAELPVSTTTEVAVTDHHTETTNDVGGEAGEEYTEGEEAAQEEEPLKPSSGGTDTIDPPDENVGVGSMGEDDDHSEPRDPHEGIGDQHNPDRPYEGDLVTHPVTGEPTPIREVLDQAHMLIRARELIEQADNPRPEPVPIPERDVPVRAFDTLMALQDKVTSWELIREQPTEGDRIVRTYNTEQASTEVPGKVTSFTAQLSYGDASATVPEFGNLSIIESAGGWPRELYFQANTVPTYAGDQPKIYYDDYPWHEETLGRPERNTEFGLQQAQRMIARAPQIAEGQQDENEQK